MLLMLTAGCASVEPARRVSRSTKAPSVGPESPPSTGHLITPSSQDSVAGMENAGPSHGGVVTVAHVTHPENAAEEIPAGRRNEVLQLEQVLESVQRSFPLLEAALLTRDAAFGEHLAAHGAFDLKLKGATENGPLGFYQTYRQSIGLEQPTFAGGALFGGYRVGRGNFQPWYGERQTDDGGEFRAGVTVPLARNVNIDARRAQLWRTNLDRQLAEPEIRLQLIDFVRAASYSYWDWVAAGRRHQIAASLLKIAEDRNEAIRRKVETGDTEPPVLQDNRRLIVSREAKLIEVQRKRQQASIKLSLYYRDDRGQPLVADDGQLADFPVPQPVDEDALALDIEAAIANRPELLALNLLRQQLQIDFAEARNDLLSDVQAVVAGSQDVGAPASSKNDKSQYELEAGLFLDVPVQRRKARGKMTAVGSKLGQLAAKRRMTADKISTDVMAVYAALVAAYQQIERAHESAELADRLAEIERRKFELGESDLLSVNLREQQAAEAQSTEVDAMYEYFAARADYRATLARD
ncbi:MAG: TolC family protein [Planctomycetia bacterium]|nr:TolC family protein [Planctomycetia bacterium]